MSVKLDRNENVSLHSAPMSRKRSSGSTNISTPFTSTGPAIEPSSLNSFQTSDDEPFSAFTIGNPTKMQRRASGRQPLRAVREVQVFDNPADFLAAQTGPSATQQNRPRAVSLRSRPRRNSHRLSSSFGQTQLSSASGSLSLFSSPLTGPLTSATTMTMSHQDSHEGTSSCGDLNLDMMRLDSQSSEVTRKSSLLCPNSEEQSFSDLDRTYLLGHTGGVADNHAASPCRLQPIATAPSKSSFASDETIQLERSNYTETNATAAVRLSKHSQEQVKHSIRPIAPRLPGEAGSLLGETSNSDYQMIRIKSADGSSKDVVAIAKAPNLRQTNEKVKCTKCNEQPEGFRGEHELRRHNERAHSAVRKVWVCVDISPEKIFLAKCKACRTEKKYGAYYNAAAHLRRTHFNPKQKGRQGQSKPQEKRAGKGGGEHPSMDLLKMWMKEVEETVPGNAIRDDYNTNNEIEESATAGFPGEEATENGSTSGSIPIEQDRQLSRFSDGFDANYSLQQFQQVSSLSYQAFAPAKQPDDSSTYQPFLDGNAGLSKASNLHLDLNMNSDSNMNLNVDMNIDDGSSDSYTFFDMSPIIDGSELNDPVGRAFFDQI